MAATSGAPWWLTISLPILASIATHFLTVWRERSKSQNEWWSEWQANTKALVEKISDSATKHYIDNDSIAKTEVSAALIINDIRRLRSLVATARCVSDSDAKRTADALRFFDDSITLQEDFQNPARVARHAGSPIIGSIGKAEESLLDALRARRKPVK